MIKSLLKKIKFEAGLNPVVENASQSEKFIPSGYKAVVTITADFELAWAWRYSKNSTDSLSLALTKGKLERSNVPLLVELCALYTIPVTWATVGHLFLSSCKKEEKPHANLSRVGQFENEYWKFSGDDWFEYDPCSDIQKAPEWYGRDLIELIHKSKVKHEFGCHTFSHLDCRDSVCSPDTFREELNECVKVSDGIVNEYTSFVHPGHTIGNLAVLEELGYTSYQTDPGNILAYPERIGKLWNFKRTMEFSMRAGWSVNYHIRFYKKIIDRAIRSNTVCNFWFHPSFSPEFAQHVFPAILEYLDSKRSEVYITTVGDYVKFLDGNKSA